MVAPRRLLLRAQCTQGLASQVAVLKDHPVQISICEVSLGHVEAGQHRPHDVWDLSACCGSIQKVAGAVKQRSERPLRGEYVSPVSSLLVRVWCQDEAAILGR